MLWWARPFLNCLPFLSGYMSVFSSPQRQKWIKAKKKKKGSLNDLIHLHSDLIFDHFDVNAWPGYVNDVVVFLIWVLMPSDCSYHTGLGVYPIRSALKERVRKVRHA